MVIFMVMRLKKVVDYILPLNILLVIYFIVMNFLDFFSTITFFRLGHIELNKFIDGFLQKDAILQLFLLKVVFTAIILIAFIIVEKYFENKYPDNRFFRIAPLSFSIMFLVVDILMTFVVINNVLIIGGGFGFICQ